MCKPLMDRIEDARRDSTFFQLDEKAQAAIAKAEPLAEYVGQRPEIIDLVKVKSVNWWVVGYAGAEIEITLYSGRRVIFRIEDGDPDDVADAVEILGRIADVCDAAHGELEPRIYDESARREYYQSIEADRRFHQLHDELKI